LFIEDQELFNDEEAHYSGINRSNDDNDRKAVTKWLLDTGASINAETLENSVTNEKPCNYMVNIADGNTITPRGIGEKTIYDYKSGYPSSIK
jgi:hypothetical protein